MDVRTLLFSTFGGFSPEVIELLQQAAKERGERLRGDEYDDTTWSARSWTVYASQRLSCALMPRWRSSWRTPSRALIGA